MSEEHSPVSNEKIQEAIAALDTVGFQVLGIERRYNQYSVPAREEKLICVVLKKEHLTATDC